MGQILVISLLTLVITFGILGLLWSSKIEKLAAQARIKLQRLRPASLIRYPHILRTNIVYATGLYKTSVVEVTPEAVYVFGGRRKSLLARLTMAEINLVIHWDMAGTGHPMAGLALSTKAGQYRFFHEGLLAAYRMEQTAKVIGVTCEEATGRAIPVVNHGEQILHTIGRNLMNTKEE